jgi:hypothetical protein
MEIDSLEEASISSVYMSKKNIILYQKDLMFTSETYYLAMAYPC